jgi:protein-disulfide isomerase
VKMAMRCISAFALATIFLSPPSRAQVPACDRLSGEKKKLAESILAQEHPYDCCDLTLAECLKQKPTCALAARLAENVCRRVEAGQKREEIARALSKRASFFLSNKKFAIDLSAVPAVGDGSAPVELVEYACARCPFCSKITPDLYRAVTEGPLKGKARLHLKTFPIRSHQHSKEAGMGFLAAAELGKFWEFALLAYGRFDAFCPLKQADWAEELGLEKALFEKLLQDERLREILVDNIKEGLRNGVDATPTFFINKKRFAGDLTAAEIIDVVEEEFDRVQKIEHVK